ncbi:MAG: hypothetical protein PHD67_00895 [Oscillospiraceae bacterium]|nr:hypothetical protein [Oscillospiraceae bacterium]
MNSFLDTFYGNRTAKEALVLYKQDGRFPHAILLEGEPGCGRKTFARYLACAVECGEESGPCGRCLTCRKILSGIHPDVVLIDGAGCSRSFHIDEIRRLKSGVYIRPNEAERKIYILAEAQNMTVQAQNALLKVLEEPPAGVMFLLTCDNRARLLDTILSRVTVIPLEPLTPEECRRALGERYPGEPAQRLDWLCRVFGGNLGRCVAGVEDEKVRSQAERTARLLEKISRGDDYGLLTELSALEGSRGELDSCLEQLHRACSAAYVSAWRGERAGEDSFSLAPLQCKKILAIIEKAAEFSRQNMGLSLLITWLSAELQLAAR